MGPDFNRLRRVLRDVSLDGVVPGGVVAIGHRGTLLQVEAFGSRQVAPQVAPAVPEGVYDLASLTKALVTTPLAMLAVDRGLVTLDTPAAEGFPSLADRPEITLRRLLSHSAGFPAHRKFYEAWSMGAPAKEAREAIVARAAAEPMSYVPGTKSVYSDLGFILLGAWLEKLWGERLDRVAERLIFAPLGLTSLRFPSVAPYPKGTLIAPTEDCPVRGRMVLGEVHDLNAFVMGGVAGHAGLFGTAGNVLGFAFALAAAYHGRRTGIFDGATVRTFFSPQGIPGSTWRLGFDGPSTEGSLAGDRISRGAIGHLAFTGCSFWLDPENETCVVFLCNRVHPTVREDPRFRALRRAVNDAALDDVGYRIS